MNTSIATKGQIGIMSMALALAVAGLPSVASAAVKVKASASGRVLTIVGDRADNDVLVALNPEADTIAVSADGQILGGFVAGSIDSIRVRLRGGSDALSVGLASGGQVGLRMLTVDLGGGDDYATLAADPAVTLSVEGGAGEDTVSTSSSTSGFRSVERVASWTALAPVGGGSLGYECPMDIDGTRTCVCDKADPWDCWNMFVDKCVMSPEVAESLSQCLKGSITTHCTCKPRASAITGGGDRGPIFQIPDGDIRFQLR
ncbi:MAG: hypothetical protein FJ148_07695 [Deltaproteobacteria bacterium]|nr:hypothetical protein [Deltaproteobacteria bacterium]